MSMSAHLRQCGRWVVHSSLPDESVIKKMIQQAATAAAQTPLGREGERERKRTRKTKRERNLRFEKVLLPTRSSLLCEKEKERGESHQP